MQYLLLIYENERKWIDMPPAQAETIKRGFVSLTGELVESGQYKGSNRLQPTRAAKTIRVRGGKREMTDGPFAETREQLGGFFLIDAHDVQEAISIAERIPTALTGSIEIRPIGVAGE